MVKHGNNRACPLCATKQRDYLFDMFGSKMVECANCGLVFKDAATSVAIQSVVEGDNSGRVDTLTEQRAARGYLDTLQRHVTQDSQILIVSDVCHPIIELAQAAGYDVSQRAHISELAQMSLPTAHFDAALVVYNLEKSREPSAILRQIGCALKPDAPLLLAVPMIDSWPSRWFKRNWMGWQADTWTYFDTQTIQSMLLRNGFAKLRWQGDRRAYNLEHIFSRLMSSPGRSVAGFVRFFARIIPKTLQRGISLKVTTSGLVMTARNTPLRERPILSIIMPVFNEKQTFKTTIETVLAKELPDVDKQIIIIESKSTDGTRELVQAYEAHPDITVIYEEHPRGKGHAVRQGFAAATGDIILIQDADQEYDVDDYDNLLTPLLNYRAAFVLGSRHTQGFKMREFTDNPGLATFINFGHYVFLVLLNVMYGQRLRDPFTMYKVFRRDCLHGLSFDSNRFDFDFELVIKLLRKGYQPLEIPVNYSARSFDEGKKVSVFRDPLTWIRALVKYRFSRLYQEPI